MEGTLSGEGLGDNLEIAVGLEQGALKRSWHGRVIVSLLMLSTMSGRQRPDEGRLMCHTGLAGPR